MRSTPAKGVQARRPARRARSGGPTTRMEALGAARRHALDDAREHGGIALFGPVAVAGLVGAVGEDDESGIGVEQQGLLQGFVPAQEERGLGAVDAGGFVGDAGGVFGGEAEEADGSLIDGEDFEVVRAGFDGSVEVAGGVWARGCRSWRWRRWR